jgi:hypothetical protein
MLEENRRRLVIESASQYFDNLKINHVAKPYFPPFSLFVQFDLLVPILANISEFPPSQFVLPLEVETSVNEEISRLIRNRLEQLLRVVVVAYSELSESRQETKAGIRIKEEVDARVSPATFTPVDELPFTLPPLPAWIPLSNTEPILASDQQLQAFLDTSPLARGFQCRGCLKSLVSTADVFEHFSGTIGCPRKDYEVDGSLIGGIDPFWDQFSVIESLNDAKFSPLQINKQHLSVLLSLEQTAESLLLEFRNEVEQHRPLLRWEPPPVECYVSKFRCNCGSESESWCFKVGSGALTVSEAVSFLPFFVFLLEAKFVASSTAVQALGTTHCRRATWLGNPRRTGHCHRRRILEGMSRGTFKRETQRKRCKMLQLDHNIGIPSHVFCIFNRE